MMAMTTSSSIKVNASERMRLQQHKVSLDVFLFRTEVFVAQRFIMCPRMLFRVCDFQTFAEPTVIVRDYARTLRLCAHSGKWAWRYLYPNSRLMASKYFCLADNILELPAPDAQAGAHELLNCKATREEAILRFKTQPRDHDATR
jgi:hypothetical protein